MISVWALDSLSFVPEIVITGDSVDGSDAFGGSDVVLAVREMEETEEARELGGTGTRSAGVTGVLEGGGVTGLFD